MKILLKWEMFCLAFISANSQESSENPMVSTWTGKVSGLSMDTTVGNHFYKFLGVPYAEPPIGNLRFKDPVAKNAWTGTWNATEFSKKCVQVDFETRPPSLLGSEDCLYLNIYTPTIPIPSYWVPKSLKPVMFWIHGGGFTVGGSNEDTNPELFLDEDVLVVTVHYRLGPFGFLALQDNPELAGNIGLKDQQQALLWVNQNIKYFGGDPAKVTLFGESAGAISVHAHVLSPRIKNIFQGAILQSGTALMRYEPIFVENEVQKSSKKFVEKVGCNTTDMLECLQSKDIESLMELNEYASWEESTEDLTSYWIVQDTASPSPVLPYNPLEQMIVGNVKKVPMIIGITKDDGGVLLIIDSNMKEAFKEDNTTQLIKALGLSTENVSEEEKLTVSAMKRFYFSEGSYEDNEKNLIEMATDSWFGSPAMEVTKLHQQVSTVFPYVLNERCTKFSFSSVFGGGEKDYGVSHADDLNCLFTPNESFGSLTEDGNLTSKAMVRSWTNFAKFEDPSPYLSSEPSWPKGQVMFFEHESGFLKNEIQLENLSARSLLWEKLYWDPLKDKSEVVSTDSQQNFLTYALPYNWF